MAGGACMTEGRAWQGGVCGRGAPPSRYYEIRSMSARYASYWNSFFLLKILYLIVVCTIVFCRFMQA